MEAAEVDEGDAEEVVAEGAEEAAKRAGDDGGAGAGPAAGLAEPGGICIAESVHFQVKAKSDLAFDDLGSHEVKNIAEPLRVFRVLTGTPQAASTYSPGIQQ